MLSRRDFLQVAVAAATISSAPESISQAAAKQRISQNDLLKFNSTGQVTLLNFTDCHAQIVPLYFREPSINIGVGAAIGAKLAASDSPVIGLVGDGSLYYADSGLWTTVHHNIPLLYVISNNGAYGIVAGAFGRSVGTMSDTGIYEGVVLDGIDPVKIADAFGLEGETIESEDSINETFERALKIVQEESRPYLLDVRLPTGLPEGGVANQTFKMR